MATYEDLYQHIKEALGEERYNRSKEECLSNNCYSMITILTNAIEHLRDEAGDFD